MSKLESNYYSIPARRAIECKFKNTSSGSGVEIKDGYNGKKITVSIPYGAECWEYIALDELKKRGFNVESRARVDQTVYFIVNNWGNDYKTL